jgi:XTP/dITP diphosphohydrolase
MEIVIATRNKGKVMEFGRILQGRGLTIRTLDDLIDCPEVDEDQETFEGNAIKKAVAVSGCMDMIAVSDDSGLEVDALGGRPGVKSARYAGDGASDHENNDKLLADMQGLSTTERRARFVCLIALAFPDGRVETFEGVVEGQVGERAVGSCGFGYDPLFYPAGSDRSFGEMDAAEKDAISHRRMALDKLGRYLEEIASLS